jgi:hypothetical protein
MRKMKRARPSFEVFSNMILLALLDWLTPYTLELSATLRRLLPPPSTSEVSWRGPAELMKILYMV